MSLLPPGNRLTAYFTNDSFIPMTFYYCHETVRWLTYRGEIYHGLQFGESKSVVISPSAMLPPHQPCYPSSAMLPHQLWLPGVCWCSYSPTTVFPTPFLMNWGLPKVPFPKEDIKVTLGIMPWFMCMRVLPEHRYVQGVHAVPTETISGHWNPGVLDSCEPCCGCWEPNLDPLQALLTVESITQPWKNSSVLLYIYLWKAFTQTMVITVQF